MYVTYLNVAIWWLFLTASTEEYYEQTNLYQRFGKGAPHLS